MKPQSFVVLPLLLCLGAPFLAAQEQAPGPGPDHKPLARFAGSWSWTAKNHMDPSGQPMTMQGSDETTAACNGMWFVSNVTGTSMPFAGYAITGWDQTKSKYVGVWIDSWSPSPSRSEGTYDSKSDSFHFTGEMMMPQGMVKTRTVMNWKGDDAREEKVWAIGEGGKEQLMMELSFQRQKPGAKAMPAAAAKDPAAAKAPAAGGMPSPKVAEHAALGAYVGSWKAKMTMSMPGMPAEDPTDMTQVDSFVCDDMWVLTKVKASIMGAPFEGIGLMGYDALQKHYTSFWVDSMSPTVMSSTGTYDAAKKAFSLSGEGIGMDGSPVVSSDLTTFTDKDHRTMVMKSKTKDGKDAGTMTIEYSRAK